MPCASNAGLPLRRCGTIATRRLRRSGGKHNTGCPGSVGPPSPSAGPWVRSVGPGGNFLGEVHTATHFLSELWFPEILDRNYFENWAANGRTDLLQRACARQEDLLRSHEVAPLPDDLRRDMDKLIGDAKRHLTEG